MKFTQPLTTKLADQAAETVRQNVDQRVRELQLLPCVDARVFTLTMPNNVVVFLPHRLGREPLFVGPSAIRGAVAAGLMQDFGHLDPVGQPIDRTQVVPLRAFGYGGTVTVDWLVL